jgi:predicted alpha/beta-hydrolase family hydrolase
MAEVEPLLDRSLDPPVRGFLHRALDGGHDALVLTHGAGGNAKSALLEALATAMAAAAVTVLRCDLPFRQLRPFGPPRPGDAASDREGLKNAVRVMRRFASGRVFLGGQSYGGRQASMLCAESSELADGLLLLSYPFHAPSRPERRRIEHWPKIRIPCLFVHGTRDPFGAIEEIRSAIKLIPAKTELLSVENAGHDLGFKGKSRRPELPPAVVLKFKQLCPV